MQAYPKAEAPRAVARLAYAIVGTIAALAVIAVGRDPLHMSPGLGLGPSVLGLDATIEMGDLGTKAAEGDRIAAIALSSGLGLLVAVATIAYSRSYAIRSKRARALMDALRPSVVGATTGELFVTALFSGVAEEILFRGALVPAVGVVISALLFGLLHQVKGVARWYWATWAVVMGLVFGVIFRATGELAGAVIAHVAINAHNLLLIRDSPSDPAASTQE